MTKRILYDIMKEKNLQVNKMSEKIMKTVICPKCSEKSDAEIICSVNEKDMPDMKKSVLSDRFFKWKCPRCSFETQLFHPLLYNDIENGFMIYYIPQTKRRILADEKIEKEFADLDIKKRLVSNVSELKEKIALLDGHTDDMAMELAKHAVERIVEKTADMTVYEGYFLDMNKAENTVSFQFFVGAERHPYIQTTRLEVYRRSLDIVRQYFSETDKQDGFIRIDRDWAKEAFKIYKSK